ncbi:acyl-CoA dehydrogenase family protein [Xanthobacter aminoxidans]|uniref:acyl-CoA dehydrogenase family protein n=1 Tax=Xanthobacter aminoxidans TaxID=186280 RepID=UPI002022EE1A|nr:acyl-CoA dehydrogenase family protein [Xanthobacter aminoxidans]MCL8383469.1 acyl-CoA dehydrogenase family protein [Xanthobacter aminoxidans]
MNLEYSTEQTLLADSVERLLSQRRATDRRAIWAACAELGLLALPFPEDMGGLAGGNVEAQIVMEAVGRHLADVPYIGCAVGPGAILGLCPETLRLRELVAAIAEGSRTACLAHEEEHARYRLAHVETRAERTASGFVLNGKKTGIATIDGVDELIVSARLSGAAGDETGIALFLVPADLPGVRMRTFPAFDGTTLAIVGLSDVALPPDALLASDKGALAALDRAEAASLSAVCGEAVGILEAMLDETVAYLKTRQQFGGPIGRFQALQHRAAEMYVALEQARSMALLAAVSVDLPDREERWRMLAAAKVQINASLRFVGQQAVQLHGGIGVTEECRVGRCFKRTAMIERAFGDTFHHLAVLDRLGGLEGRLPRTAPAQANGRAA